MEKKQKISQYRERLDKSLASPDLTNGEMVKALVKNQLLSSSKPGLQGCSENVLEKRTLEVANFLDMLRSVSKEDEAPKAHDTSQPEWKLKQDTEEFRVMYREGDQGTPFHSLLVEGYVDGPVDECLCVSWESSLYKKWWPQNMIPTFKIISSKCVQKVRIGEQISLVRMKVPWPLSAREALVHYFELEYTRDDLVIVLVNTISDVKSVNRDTHGFSKDGIPEAKDVVRIDLVGGFVIQKVTSERSYFRTIARMDIKVDFVPPSLINFIARQLVGNGFRLYEKIVATAFKTDEDFSKALADPLYVRIRKALSSNDEAELILEQDELNSDTFSLPEDQSLGNMKDEHHNVEVGSEDKEKSVIEVKKACEIEEEEHSGDDSDDEDLIDTVGNGMKSYVNGNKKVVVSPKVEEALGTLDKVISLIHEYGLKDSNPSVPSEASQEELVDKSLQQPRNSSGSQDSRSSKSNAYSSELNLNKMSATSTETNHREHVTGDANGREKSSLPGGARSGRRIKLKFCCF